MRVNALRQQTLGLNFFTNDQLEEIHFAALEILNRIGVRVYSEEALELLRKGGARINGDIAKIPAFMVQDALSSAPCKISIGTRDGKRAMQLQKNSIHFGTGSDTPFVYDLFTGERRTSKKSDVVNYARLSDALQNIDFVMSLALASDVPTLLSYKHHFEAMVTNTTKPICFTAHNAQDLKDIIEMAEVAIDGAENLVANPFIFAYLEPTSPLVHSQEAIEKLMICAEKNVPAIYAIAILGGASGPVTQAGAIAQGIAEMLSGLVIHQLKCKGAPIIFGGGARPMNMTTMGCPYGGPEPDLGRIAVVKMAQYYNLPSFTTSGCSDAQVFDQQAGMEIGFSLLSAGLAGGNLIHDLGYLGMGMTSSMESLLLCNETAGIVKHFLRGIEINEETLAFDTIEKVGPGGNYLTEEHTFKNFRNQIFDTKLLNRNGYDKWAQNGAYSFKDMANKKAQEILENHKPVLLSIEKVNKIKEIACREI